MAPESRAFAGSAHLPTIHDVLGALAIEWPRSPLNLALPLALAAALFVYFAVWRSQPGYALRAVGFAPEAARYAGIRPRAQILLSMALAGALAGLVSYNFV